MGVIAPPHLTKWVIADLAMEMSDCENNNVGLIRINI